MADETPKTPAALKKFVYPFQKTDNSTPDKPKTVEIVDSQEYFDALSKAQDGFYPIGANGQWHGGVHFGKETGAVLAQSTGVRCVADGEVIAYRIDSKYPDVPYASCGAAKYSTGFVLVRHALALPPAPKKAATGGTTTPATSGTAAAAKTEEPRLTLYSLYMHLSDWAAYEADKKIKRPAYWGGDKTRYEVATKAVDANPYPDTVKDAGKGLKIRQGNGGKTAQIGWAAPGTKLTLEAGDGKWRKIASVDGGTIHADPKNAATADAPLGWAYVDELDPAAAEPKSKDSVVVLDKPVKVTAGELIGYLGQYQRYVDMSPLGSSCTERPLAQVDLFTGDDIKAFIEKSKARAKELDAKDKILLKVDVGAKLAMPGEPDQRIAATEGVVATTDSKASGEWMQVRKGKLEIVGKDTLKGYDDKTNAYDNGSVLSRMVGATDADAITPADYNALGKAAKKAYGRREVLVPAGTPIWVQKSLLGGNRFVINREMQAWSKFPLDAAAAAGAEAGYLRVAPIATLKKMAAEADGTRWWQIDVGTQDGGSQTGWAREKDHAKVTLCTPWDWPGFEVLKTDTTTPASFYANLRVQQAATTEADKEKLQPQAAQADGGVIFQKLYGVIDNLETKDAKLSPEELRRALRQPWLAQAISRLITSYESEWAGPMAKWDAIDSDIPENRKEDWAQEKKRIEKLNWWDQLKGKSGFPSTTTPTHFHPIGLIANFYRPCPEECKVAVYELQTSAGVFRVSKESFEYVLEVEQYQEFPYVPGGTSASGITIGYGYDLGYQPEASVRSDLNGLYTSDEIDKLVDVLGKTQESARTALSKVSDISISKDNALTLALRMKKRYAEDTVEAYPQVIDLHPHCQGALLSLVINRGNSFTKPSAESRLEMKQIRDDLDANKPENIPGRLRAMKRIWEGSGQGGLLKRRDKEADFFERGLKCDCWD